MVAKYCPGLTETDAAGSIYAVWLQRYQLPIEFADESIRAVNIRGSDARALQVRDGEAGMLVTSVGYLTVRRPLWYERTLYRGAAYEFQNRLTGIAIRGDLPGQASSWTPAKRPIWSGAKIFASIDLGGTNTACALASGEGSNM